jgi:hypothetical protein
MSCYMAQPLVCPITALMVRGLRAVDRLIYAVCFESFLATKYNTTKRFGLEVPIHTLMLNQARMLLSSVCPSHARART